MEEAGVAHDLKKAASKEKAVDGSPATATPPPPEKVIGTH